MILNFKIQNKEFEATLSDDSKNYNGYYPIAAYRGQTPIGYETLSVSESGDVKILIFNNLKDFPYEYNKRNLEVDDLEKHDWHTICRGSIYCNSTERYGLN